MSGVPAPTPLPAVWRNARALHDRGDTRQAVTLLEEAVQTGATAYGWDHPDVLAAARMLAALHWETDELTSARRTLEQALAAGQRTLPAGHPLILLLTHDLGFVADALGNRHEARRNLGVVASLGPAAHGADHPAVLAATRYLRPEAGDVAPNTPPPATATSPAAPARSTAPNPPAPTVLPPNAPWPTTPFAPAPVPTPPAAAGPGPSSPAPRRTPLIAGVAVAVVAGAIITFVAALPGQHERAPTDGPGTTAANPPAAATATTEPPARGPTEVRLRDEGTAVTLTWRDPTAGTVPFIVAGALAGEQSRPFANLPAGRTTYTVNGLNPRLEYCFTVVAVYSTDNFTASDLTCTTRGSRGPTRTTTSP